MFSTLAEKRRSIRVYEKRPVEAEKIAEIVEAALRSPSGRAARPWSLVVVTENSLLEKLSTARPHGVAFVKEAPVVIVVCGDESASPIWLEDCTIAAITIQYAAQDLGLGSCWSTMRGKQYSEAMTSTQYISGLLGLPEHLTVLCLIAIGHPGEVYPPYKKEELRFDKVSYNYYGKRLI